MSENTRIGRPLSQSTISLARDTASLQQNDLAFDERNRMTILQVGAVLLSLTISTLAQYSPTPTGLVSWWRGDGNATDTAGGHDGTLQGGMTFTNGLFGQAFAAGSGRRVYVPDSPAFALNSFTIGAWINIHAKSYSVFFRGDLDTIGIAMGIDFDATGGIGLRIGSSPNSDTLYTPITYHQWHHVAVSFDGSIKQMRVYVDGILAAQKTTTVSPPTLNPSRTPGIGIGNSQSFYDFPFLGDIDELVLYSRVLSPAEISGLAVNTCHPHQATATAQVVNGFVVGATMNDAGCGYTNTPIVLILGGGGSGATATAVASNGVVVNINITDAGVGYSSLPAIYIYSPDGPQITLAKAVRPSSSDLLLGSNYQFQASADLKTWTNIGSSFVATNPLMTLPQYLDVDNWNYLFFRVKMNP